MAKTTRPRSQTPATDATAAWAAVASRDRSCDASLVYAVVTTGVYCKPSCASRPPKRENVRFFATPTDAEQAGFRACLRCRPRIAASNPHAALVTRICRYIERNEEEVVTLAQLSEVFRQSPFHLQRRFKSVLGITPKAYADECRLRRFKENLRAGQSVTRAMYDAGYGSSSRVYENAAGQLGMTPDKYRRGAVAEVIRYTTAASPIGRMLVAATAKGVCAVQFADSDEELEHGVRREYPFAARKRDDVELRGYVTMLIEKMKHEEAGGSHDSTRDSAKSLPLDIRATAFQRLVWEHLRTIPRGTTQSYGEIAEKLGDAHKARAVARVCATNPVAVAIPCHRVVRGNGELSGYRWGAPRKQKLLAMEGAR